MNINQNILIGVEALRAHRVRSVLTSLGIIFGVAAVIAMLSIGEGARQEALEQIRLMGVNNILIRAKDAPRPASSREARASFSPGLGGLDAAAIAEICPSIEYVVPHWEKTDEGQYVSAHRDLTIIGTTPEFQNAFNYTITAGRFFSREDLAAQSNVCVIGSDVKDALFRLVSPLGKQLKIGDQWFVVIGVMERQRAPNKKVANLDIRNLNLDVYVPITTAQYKMERQKPVTGRGDQGMLARMSGQQDNMAPVPRERLDQITVNIRDGAPIDEATQVIRRILNRTHFGINDFEIIVPESLVEQSQKTQQIFNVVMGAIAGISLLVGGIGIMNIMLASVLERTREIGVRRAVGATQADVMGQFLFEATFLSVVGGIVGILLGFSLTRAITLYAEWRTVVSIPAVILAFTVSAAVGIGFGFYPARKAALQNPIESLRYE